jgi:NADP-dependent 3-hydroxy acid dehydrogenase YdfG
MPVLVVLGAANLGGAILEHHLAAGWTGAAISPGGTLIQVTGGSARRPLPGKGLWGAGAAATRALTLASAQELRERGIHVALLVIDATIESPKTAAYTAGVPREQLADQKDIARAVEYLASQTPRAYTHEVVLTPGGERWIP